MAARTKERLSAMFVEKTKKPGTYTDGGSLYLQVTLGKRDPKTRQRHVRKSWLFCYELRGVRHEMGLGPLDDVPLADAREQARQHRLQLRAGIDPLDAKREALQAMLDAKREAEQARLKEKVQTITFRQAARSCYDLHADGWKSADHRHQWWSSIERYAFPTIGDLAVGDVNEAAVMKVVEPCWKTKNVTMTRVLDRIKTVLDYATAHKMRSGENPARAIISALPKPGVVQKKTKTKFAAVPYGELPLLVAELKDKDSVAALALEFTILTAARTEETRGATWAEFKGGMRDGVWTVPKERMKRDREHRVPLSVYAMTILGELKDRGHKQPFAGISYRAMYDLLVSLRPGMTVHGLRSSFKDWAEDCTNFPSNIVEAALAHATGDKTEQAYRRSDALEKRRKLMHAWSKYLSDPKNARAADGENVVTLRDHKALASRA